MAVMPNKAIETDAKRTRGSWPSRLEMKPRATPPADPDWFEISDDLWRDPRVKGKKLKLLADEQVPARVLAEMREAKIAVDALPAGAKRTPDPSVLSIAQKKGRVLLTLDGGFWNDHKHPLHQLRTGIIYVAEPPDAHDRILRAFGLVYGCFAKSYPLDWWRQMKVRATVGEFELKMRSRESKIVRYRMRLRGGQVLARELQPDRGIL
jgi:Domain of unknown function (DUF5615)